MTINQVFEITHQVAETVLRAWGENEAESQLILMDNRSVSIDTTGRRTNTGLLLEFAEYKPTAIITPCGELRFAGSGTNNLLARLHAFNSLAQKLNLADTDIAGKEKTFFLVINPVHRSDSPQLTEQLPRNEENEEAWHQLTLKWIRDSTK
jgi:hypothetical protein